MSDHPTPEGILKLGFSFWASKTLLSAVELGLFTELAGGTLNEAAIRKRLGLGERGTRDFLDALVSLGMLTRNGEGEYGNTTETELFLDRNKPFYVGGLLEMAGSRLYPFWGNLTEALKTGEPQNEAKRGEDFFGKLYAEPKRLKQFLEAMTGVSLGAAHTMAAKFPWGDYKSLVDVGCAQGAMPVAVAKAHGHLKAIGYDLPTVRPVFEEYVASHGVADRVTFQEGDFFADDKLPSADVVVMGHILHDWNLEEKKMLLRKAYEALPEGGSLIVYEALIDDDRAHNTFGLLMSLNMLVETPGGFDYTGADCTGWMKEAGFQTVRVEHLIGPDSMVIGTK